MDQIHITHGSLNFVFWNALVKRKFTWSQFQVEFSYSTWAHPKDFFVANCQYLGMASSLLELSKSTYCLQSCYHFSFIVIYGPIKTKSPQDVTIGAFYSLS